MEFYKDLKNLNYLTNDTIRPLLKPSDHSIEPKPIVSSTPRPIVIDSNLVSKKNNDINQTSSKLSAIKDLTKEDDNVKTISTLNLNEIMMGLGSEGEILCVLKM